MLPGLSDKQKNKELGVRIFITKLFTAFIFVLLQSHILYAANTETFYLGCFSWGQPTHPKFFIELSLENGSVTDPYGIEVKEVLMKTIQADGAEMIIPLEIRGTTIFGYKKGSKNKFMNIAIRDLFELRLENFQTSYGYDIGDFSMMITDIQISEQAKEKYFQNSDENILSLTTQRICNWSSPERF